MVPSGSVVPSASLWINDTMGTSDDLTLEGEELPLSVVGTPNATVQLTISGPASLSTSQVTLDGNGVGHAVILPTGLSVNADDVDVSAFTTLNAGLVKFDEERATFVK